MLDVGKLRVAAGKAGVDEEELAKHLGATETTVDFDAFCSLIESHDGLYEKLDADGGVLQKALIDKGAAGGAQLLARLGDARRGDARRVRGGR